MYIREWANYNRITAVFCLWYENLNFNYYLWTLHVFKNEPYTWPYYFGEVSNFPTLRPCPKCDIKHSLTNSKHWHIRAKKSDLWPPKYAKMRFWPGLCSEPAGKLMTLGWRGNTPPHLSHRTRCLNSRTFYLVGWGITRNISHPHSGLSPVHRSDPHCHLHLCHHQSLLLFFTLDLKHISSSSLFPRRLHHRYTGLISRTLNRTVFLLHIGFVLVFSSRLSAVD